MLDILLTARDGGTAWRHQLADGEARAGFECVGPLGLAKRLGRILGLRAEPADPPSRLAAVAARLDALDDGARSFTASRRNDPFGVARHLLALRDELRLAGWDGGPLGGSGRLQDLAAVERGDPASAALPPGLPDVLASLLGELRAAGPLPFPIRIRLASPRRAFAPLLARLLDALAAAGAIVEPPPPPAPRAAAGTDLGRVQRALLDPDGPRAALRGDGTFLLLEADTPAEAAELAASMARTLPLGGATFVVPAAPAVLDAALARQGLPTLGLGASSPLRPHLQVLPLRLSLAFRPQDPHRAAELLLLPGAPLGGEPRRALLGALDQMPGVGGPAWQEAIERCVASEIVRAEDRGEPAPRASAAGAALRERIEGWFGGELHPPDVGIPAAKAAALCAAVAAWASGRMAASAARAEAEPGDGAGEDATLWAQAVAVARTLEKMLLARPAGEPLPEPTLMRLHALAVGNGSDLAPFEAEAGRPAVAASPADVIAACDDVLWWAFVLDADAGPAPEPWTGSERAALLGAGVALPAPGERRAVEAEGWRAPLLAPRGRAALVRWRLAAAEAIAPHAFRDELASRVAEGALCACTVSSERVLGGHAAPWPAATAPVAPDVPMAQRPVWKVPAATLAPVAALSASALDVFLGCPFRWALRYAGKLEPGRGVRIPEGSQLLGSFAHRILQDLLCGPERLDFDRATVDDARRRAAEAFDARVGAEAAPLVRRGLEVERARARQRIADAAGALLGFLRGAGWRPVDAEREVTGRFAGFPAHGFIDLVVEKGGAEAVVDLKLSGLRYRREELETGRALQTALYASLLRRRGEGLPPSGFFILEDGEFLTADPLAFPGATVVEGPSAAATLEGAEKGFGYWRRVLDAGLLPALHPDLDWEGPVRAAAGPPPAEGSPAHREDPCRFCDYGEICAPPAADPDAEVAP